MHCVFHLGIILKEGFRGCLRLLKLFWSTLLSGFKNMYNVLIVLMLYCKTLLLLLRCDTGKVRVSCVITDVIT